MGATGGNKVERTAEPSQAPFDSDELLDKASHPEARQSLGYEVFLSRCSRSC